MLLFLLFFLFFARREQGTGGGIHSLLPGPTMKSMKNESRRNHDDQLVLFFFPFVVHPFSPSTDPKAHNAMQTQSAHRIVFVRPLIYMHTPFTFARPSLHHDDRTIPSRQIG
jgi:hypothetical protein